MLLTLKQFQYTARLSEETHCFSAVVCIDGKAMFLASNRGQGGCDSYDPLTYDDKGRKLLSEGLAAIKAHCATLPVRKFQGVDLPENIEMLLVRAVNAELEKKAKAKFGRDLLKKIEMLENGKLYEIKLKVAGPITPEIVARMAAKYPKATILNGKPLDEAWAIARSHCGFTSDED